MGNKSNWRQKAIKIQSKNQLKYGEEKIQLKNKKPLL